MSAESTPASCSVFIATSLDGYIAGPDGDMGWLDRVNALVPAGEDCGYGEFMAGVDALVMGRRSFEQVLTFPEWPYGDLPLVVLSRSLERLPEGLPASVQCSGETPADLVRRLGAAGLRRLYVDGGQTIQSFLAAGLIDTLVITRIPVLLGGGLPLFGSLPGPVELVHEATRVFDWGFVQSRYRISRA